MRWAFHHAWWYTQKYLPVIVNFLPRCICSHLGRLNNSSSSHSLPMKVDVSVAHRDLINLKHSFGGLLWNTLGNHLVPWQSSWDLKLESLDRLLYQRFLLLEQIHWSSQGGNDPIVLWVTMNFQQQTAQIFFEPWSWNIKPNCKWRLSSFKRKNILSKLCNSPRQLQTMANHFSGRGKAQYYFKTWGTGMAPGLKNNYLFFLAFQWMEKNTDWAFLYPYAVWPHSLHEVLTSIQMVIPQLWSIK